MNISFMIQSLNYCGQRARFERYLVIINSQIMTVRNNVIYGDFGRVPFTGAKEFLTVLFYEGVIIGADKDKILLRYNYLVNKKSFVK